MGATRDLEPENHSIGAAHPTRACGLVMRPVGSPLAVGHSFDPLEEPQIANEIMPRQSEISGGGVGRWVKS